MNGYSKKRVSRTLRTVCALSVGLSLATMGVIATLNPAGAEESQGQQSSVQTKASEKKHFMVYYRAWRDKTMKGVNTSLPDENWMTMYDIPYGIDVVNVFSYVPQGQENQAKPFYDALKAEYAPALHARGVKLVRGIGYPTLLDVPHAGATPTQAEYDAYAQQLVDEKMTSLGLDGLDIDMEQYPSAQDVAISDGVIKALSKLIGPKANNGTLFLYDTNGSYVQPLAHVSDCFDFLAYQQYGSRSNRTAGAVQDYAGLMPANKFVPGLTFPEEQDDNNRWYDATEPYENSNIFDVASYVHQQGLGGMFLYALDRDGRTYEPDDLNHIKPSNLLWTKTAIAESQGMGLENAKSLAQHYLARLSYSKEPPESVSEGISQATSLYAVNKAILGPTYEQAYSPTYDPTLEEQLASIDLTALTGYMDKAKAILDQPSSYSSDPKADLRLAYNQAVAGIAAKSYTAAQVSAWSASLKTALDPFTQAPTPEPVAPAPTPVTPVPTASTPPSATGHSTDPASTKSLAKSGVNLQPVLMFIALSSVLAVICGTVRLVTWNRQTGR